VIDGWILHEAVTQDHPRDALDYLDDFGTVFRCNARGLLDQHGDQHHALVQNAIVLDELRHGERNAVGGGRQKHSRTRQPRMALGDGCLDQILFRLAQCAADRGREGKSIGTD
jgi:hypothetical protein